MARPGELVAKSWFARGASTLSSCMDYFELRCANKVKASLTISILSACVVENDVYSERRGIAQREPDCAHNIANSYLLLRGMEEPSMAIPTSHGAQLNARVDLTWFSAKSVNSGQRRKQLTIYLFTICHDTGIQMSRRRTFTNTNQAPV